MTGALHALPLVVMWPIDRRERGGDETPPSTVHQPAVEGAAASPPRWFRHRPLLSAPQTALARARAESISG
jgi:hypothetical protein